MVDPTIANIVKFDGTGNFDIWKNSVYLVLVSQGLKRCVASDRRTLDDSTGRIVFNSKDSVADASASLIIRGCISDDYRGFLLSSTAYELWVELKNLFNLAKTSKIIMQLSKLLACKMQPGDKLGHTRTAKFKSLSSDMQASELTHAQLMALIYLSALNDEFRSVATYFGVMRPSSLTLNKVANMVCEHTDTLLAGVEQDWESFAGASHNSGNIVCQYCKKSGHTAEKCFAIVNLKNEPKSDDSGSSSKYTNGGGSGNPKKPHHKPKKNTFSVKIGGISILAAHSAASSLLDRPVLSSSLCQVYLHTMFKAL